MTKQKLPGKVAIVTGASSGIGQATALALSERGVRVGLAARNLTALKALEYEITRLGGEALVAPVDVTDFQQVKEMVETVQSRWGRIDALVSNAGQYIRASIRELTDDTLEKSMAINFYGHVHCVRAVLPHMERQANGHIVLVSSMDARKGLMPDAPYVSAKFALAGYGEVLRQEVKPAGIAVTTLYPGRVDTPMTEDLEVPLISAKISAQQVARAILRSIEHRPAEVYIPFHVYFLYILNVFAPRLADAVALGFGLEGRPKLKGS